MTADRDALIKAGDAALGRKWVEGYSDSLTEVVLDAIVPLIADAIRAGEYRPDRTTTDYGAGVSMGAMIATDHAVATVQALLGDTDGDR